MDINLFEKLAAPAWKKKLGEMSLADRIRLQKSGILNYDRETIKRNKRVVRYAKANGSPMIVKGNDKHRRAIAEYFNIDDIPSMFPTPGMNRAKKVLFDGRMSQFPAKLNVPDSLIMASDMYSNNNSNIGNIMSKIFNVNKARKTLKGRALLRELDSIMNAHEAVFENSRPLIKNSIKTDRNFVNDYNAYTKKALAQTKIKDPLNKRTANVPDDILNMHGNARAQIPHMYFYSHADPKVVYLESKEVATASPAARSIMRKLRSLPSNNTASEIESLRKYSHNYGNNSVYDRKSANRHYTDFLNNK